MELFNGCIHETEELLSGSSAKKWTYDPAACWAETSRNELVMLREAAYELGGSAKSAVSYSCVSAATPSAAASPSGTLALTISANSARRKMFAVCA